MRSLAAALPEGWTVASLEDLAAEEPGAITDGPFGSNLKTEHYTAVGPRVIRLQNIGEMVFRDDRAHISEAHYERLQKHGCRAGDIVVALLGDRLPRACVVPEIGPAIVKADCVRVRTNPERVNAAYLMYALNSPDLQRRVSPRGVGRPRLRLKDLREIEIPLAPRSDQDAIVSEIEKQFTRLDAAVQSLAQARTKLKAYRTAMLIAATTGKLVPAEDCSKSDSESGSELVERIAQARRSRWESRTNRPYKQPVAPIAPPSDLPETWGVASVEQLTEAERPCAYGVLQPGDHVEGGIPFIRVGDIDDGTVDTSQLKAIAPTIAARYPRTRLQGSEVLITLVGSIGRTAVVPMELHGANTARAVGVLPVTDLVLSRWVEIWFRSPAQMTSLTSQAHEVARKTLNLEDVKRAAVGMPPVSEQQRIVLAVERQSSVIRVLDSEIDAALRRADRMKAAILQSAFLGAFLRDADAVTIS